MRQFNVERQWYHSDNKFLNRNKEGRRKIYFHVESPKYQYDPYLLLNKK